MVPRKSAHVVAVVGVVAPTPPIVAPLMAFVRLPVLAVVVAALPDLTLVGSSRPRLHPVFASAMAPHH